MIRFELYTLPTCPNCPPMKSFLADCGIPGSFVNALDESGFQKARLLGIQHVPTVVFFNDGKEVGRCTDLADARHVVERTLEEIGG